MAEPLKQVFKSSVPEAGRGELTIYLWPSQARAEFFTSRGESCTLTGEDLGKLVAWLHRDDYKLPR